MARGGRRRRSPRRRPATVAANRPTTRAKTAETSVGTPSIILDRLNALGVGAKGRGEIHAEAAGAIARCKADRRVPKRRARLLRRFQHQLHTSAFPPAASYDSTTFSTKSLRTRSYAVSNISAVSDRTIPQPSCSNRNAPRPNATSKRPLQIMSSVRISSAARTGWWYGSTVVITPSRSRSVRAASCATRRFGDPRTLYFGSKWCSAR